MRMVRVFWFLVLLPIAAWAGHYELVKGQGVDVCEAYLKNLNAFGYPMVCEREIDPEFGSLKKPKWKKIDFNLAEKLAWEEYEMALISMGIVLDDKRRIGHREWMNEQIRNGVIVFWESKIDINNDGVLERVVKKRQGICPVNHAFAVEIFIITKDGKNIDLEKTKYVNANMSEIADKIAKKSGRKEFGDAGFPRNKLWGYALYDVFMYKGKAYFDFWEMGIEYPEIKSAHLHVFLYQDNLTREMCTYRFVGQAK